WAYLDADADGAISPRELDDGQQAARLLLALSWEGCDADGDGKLSLAEYHAGAFQAAQALPTSDDENAQQAETALADAVPLSLLLERLGEDSSYAAELAALWEAVDDQDDQTVITQVISNPTRYPKLGPVLRTWVRHYPVKSNLRRHGHRTPHAVKPARIHPNPKAKPKKGPPHTKKPAGVGKPAGRKPAARHSPKRGGRKP
ncbi:MAG: hypothetical protein GY842_22535, partial [bacterium]|nr:hypothetical protein [bacterium]